VSEEIPVRTLLVPLDGSEFSFRAAKYAIKIAKMSKAELVCVHSVVNLPYNEHATAGVVITRYIDESKKQAEKWYDEVKTMASKNGVKVTSETILDVLSVADSIINYAEKRNVDIIIIGTKGRTGLKRFILGSVANGVIAHAKCPVLVVR
jgi:nucleotide-binding universal stress UspA family protein